jgi:hypothetical protein
MGNQSSCSGVTVKYIIVPFPCNSYQRCWQEVCVIPFAFAVILGRRIVACGLNLGTWYWPLCYKRAPSFPKGSRDWGSIYIYIYTHTHTHTQSTLLLLRHIVPVSQCWPTPLRCNIMSRVVCKHRRSPKIPTLYPPHCTVKSCMTTSIIFNFVSVPCIWKQLIAPVSSASYHKDRVWRLLQKMHDFTFFFTGCGLSRKVAHFKTVHTRPFKFQQQYIPQNVNHVFMAILFPI